MTALTAAAYWLLVLTATTVTMFGATYLLVVVAAVAASALRSSFGARWLPLFGYLLVGATAALIGIATGRDPASSPASSPASNPTSLGSSVFRAAVLVLGTAGGVWLTRAVTAAVKRRVRA